MHHVMTYAVALTPEEAFINQIARSCLDQAEPPPTIQLRN